MQRTECGQCLFVLSTPTETMVLFFPGAYHAGQHLHPTYRGDECGYHGPAVADEYDQPDNRG
ncbi:hypothetical protein HHJ44_20050 [Escherichia coli]|nr:hypothetical protein HHJ44_20050 [Escherichia coli]